MGRLTRIEPNPRAYDPHDRHVDPDGVNDPGEQVIREVQSLTGRRIQTCPWQAMKDPFVGAVLRAHKHWKAGVLDIATQPAALVDGIDAYDTALNIIRSHDQRKRIEQIQKKDKPAPDPQFGFGTPLRGHRR